MKITCDICGAQLVMLHTGVAVCSAAIETGGEMHGASIRPDAEQAKVIKRAWKNKDLPKATMLETIEAYRVEIGFHTARLYTVAGSCGLWRRVPRSSHPPTGNLPAVCDGAVVQLVRWEEVEKELEVAGFCIAQGAAALDADGIVSPLPLDPKDAPIATPETSDLKDDPFDGAPLAA